MLDFRSIDATHRKETYHAVGQRTVLVGVAAAQVFDGRVAGVPGSVHNGVDGGTYGSTGK